MKCECPEDIKTFEGRRKTEIYRTLCLTIRMSYLSFVELLSSSLIDMNMECNIYTWINSLDDRPGVRNYL